MKHDRLLQYIHGRHCEILGLGVSNLPLAKVLCELGVQLTIRDKKPPEELLGAEELIAGGVELITGEDAFDHLSGELIFRSPGIRPDRAGLADALARGTELTSEIELFLKLTDAETFAVTGSDGKTTSTTLTGKFLTAEAERRGKGKVLVGGNIGAPLLDRLPLTSSDDRAVMELSSFQLMTVDRAPNYSAITNLSPNHLDWHTGMDEYLEAKKHIIGDSTLRFVTNAECEVTARLAENLRVQRNGDVPAIYLFSSKHSSFAELFPNGAGKDDRAIYEKDGAIVLSDGTGEIPLLQVSEIQVPGRHNVENFMTAIGLTYGRVDPSVYTSVAREFRGVEHRLELIRTLHGVDYYNSSIDSSPSRTAAALSALRGRDIVIICGGYDKKIPFEPLAEALCHTVRAVVLTGQTGEKIEHVLRAHPDYREGAPEIYRESDFFDAVSTAKRVAREGGCVLLSPACASFDAFKNFAERGNTFREIVKNFEN
ncbi:MAG: UDP-N-acetylmuramoyl-L-alanine--D-glutamate ligase [Clostridia bacterium]|nr:UDP-N-acetylmuramoyl-L-alanine--D-glutamate ligase [Clostridia bacterium]